MEPKDKAIQAEHDPAVPKRHGNTLRRRLLNTLGAGILGITLTTSVGAPKPVSAHEDVTNKPSPTETLTSQEANPAEIVRQFIEAKGDEKLTFEEGASLIPHLAKLYSGRFETGLTETELTSHAFIFEGKLTKEDKEWWDEYKWYLLAITPSPVDWVDPPFLIKLKRHYPDFEYGKDIEDTNLLIKLSFTYLSDELAVGGFAIKDDTFVILGKTNETNQLLQFKKLTDSSCEPALPSTSFMNAVVHEFGHSDVTYIDIGVNNPILLNISPNGAQEEDRSGFVDGFILRMKGRKYWKTRLDEFVVQYFAVKVLTDAGLPAGDFYLNSPQSFLNFEKILDQAKIPLEDLKRLHMESRLQEFFIRFAEGAENVDLKSDEEKVKFALKVLNPLLGGWTGWEYFLKDYFKNLDLSGYDGGLTMGGQVHPGCVAQTEPSSP